MSFSGSSKIDLNVCPWAFSMDGSVHTDKQLAVKSGSSIVCLLNVYNSVFAAVFNRCKCSGALTLAVT